MWWFERNAAWRRAAAVAVVLGRGGTDRRLLPAAVGHAASAATDSVRDKLAAGRRAGDRRAERPNGGAHRGGAAQFPAIRLQRRRRRQCADLYAQGRRRRDEPVDHRRHHQRPAGRAGRFRHRQLPAHRNRNRQDRLERFDLCPCRLRHSGRGATLRQAARASATPKTAPPRSSPTPSGTGWRRTSSPAR